MFSGGSYAEVARWLAMFIAAHAKREDPHVEVLVDSGRHRAGTSYGVRLRVGDRVSPVVEYDFAHVAASRGSLVWCRTEAEQVRARARELLALAAVPAPAR